MTEQTPMSRAERLELGKIVRQRAKLAKDDVEARKRAILADAEAALAREFEREDAAWAEFVKEGEQVVAEMNAKIQAICEEKGIQKKFRPHLGTYWLSRGENAIPRRRAELRKVVQTQAEASAREAKLEIDRQAVEIQERIAVGGFESDEARSFLETLPTPEALMPALRVPELGQG